MSPSARDVSVAVESGVTAAAPVAAPAATTAPAFGATR